MCKVFYQILYSMSGYQWGAELSEMWDGCPPGITDGRVEEVKKSSAGDLAARTANGEYRVIVIVTKALE
jgi:hypothetical protein